MTVGYSPSGSASTGFVQRFFTVLLVLLPGLLIAVASNNIENEQTQLLLIGGAAVVFILGLWLTLQSIVRQRPTWIPVIAVYLTALLWLRACTFESRQWFSMLAEGILLLIPLLLFAFQLLSSSGTENLRRARLLSERLMRRNDWPSNPADCRNLPEVQALRAALQNDATPALALLTHPAPQIRIAALAALEFRGYWRSGEPERVLLCAQQAEEAAVRAGAMTALGNIDHEHLIVAMTEFLRDPAVEVRQAAGEALLWDSEKRWPIIRDAVRAALSDPRCANDGPLPCIGARLPKPAVQELLGWAAEGGPIGIRSVQTLIVHYNRLLNEEAGPELVEELSRRLLSPKTTSLLRVELAQLLREHRLLQPQLLLHMLGSEYPGPLRLMAVEQVLRVEPRSRAALEALRSLARQPNRELALATADVVQRCLGVDLGLPTGPLPPSASKLAADISRSLLTWAKQLEIPDDTEVRGSSAFLHHPGIPPNGENTAKSGSGSWGVKR